MWLIRFQNIETRDYNHIERVCEKVGISSRRFSYTLLTKGIILHLLEKKSWRKIAEQFSIPYLPLYHFYGQFEDSVELYKILLYFIERRIILWVDENHITQEYLSGEDIIIKSKQFIEQYKK